MAAEDQKIKTVKDQLYWHYTLLKNWAKNNEARMITTENYNKFTADIQRNGIEEAFEVGSDGTVYDGNNRLKIVTKLIGEGITESENAKDLQWIPVKVKEYYTEKEKWRTALTKNSQYAQWNQEGLTTYVPEFEDELDISLINVSFSDPQSIDEQIIDPKTPRQKKLKEVACPECGHKFTL